MARREQKITTKSYVHVGDQLVCTDDLSPDMKDRLGAEITCRMLNSLYAGRAVFTYDNALLLDSEKKGCA